MPPASPSRATPAELALHRLDFLARAGEALASSLDYEATLAHVAQLCVPELGDLCIVDVVEDGVLRRVATAHAQADKRELLEAMARHNPRPAESPAPAGRVLASGETELLERVTPDVVATHVRDAAHAQAVLALGIRSHLAVPMRAHGEVVGVLSLGISESDRIYGTHDRQVAEELARRAALAVENARLYRAARVEIGRREAAEAALRMSEQRFRAIMEQSPLSTQRLAPDGRTIGVNAAWEQLWGLTLDLLGDYNVLTDPQLEAKGVTPFLQRAFEGTPQLLPTIAYDPAASPVPSPRGGDGTRWVSAYAYPVRDDGGAIREVVLVHDDVTGVRRAEAEMRRSEERLNRVLAAGGVVIWDWDLHSGRIQCSSNARDFFGFDVGQAEDFLATILPEDLPHVKAVAADALATGGFDDLEYRMLMQQGRERWVQARGRVEYIDGRPARMLGVTVDITERREAEAAMRLLAEAGEVLGASLDYATTLENLARVVVPRIADWFAVDLVAADGQLERVSVYHPDPARVAIAEEIFRRYPPRPDDPGGAWQVIRSGEPEWASDIPAELILQSAHDEAHARLLMGLELRSYITVPLVARGGVIGVLTLVQAESDRRYQAADVGLALDLARRAASAVDNARLFRQLQDEHRRKDEFLATLAHELRNPLAPLRTGLALLQASRDPVVLDRTRAIMDRQLTHMVRLIDDLLDLSRVTRGTIVLQRRPIEVEACIATAVDASRPLLEAAGVALEVDVADPSLCLDADETRLAQVLTNLLNNAAKFTPRGGRVRIGSGQAEHGRLRIEVVDTGVGLDAVQLERIFDMFVRGGGADAPGLGIGLTLARRLVELHDGRLWAESDGPGRGSRFVLELPVTACARPLPGPAEAPAPGTRQHHRVLVVDDNQDAARTLATLIELDGHEVATAGSGDEALARVAAVAPDLCFLDIGLPGMSGYELARRLRADPRTAGTRLVALTGWGREEDRARAREAGFDAHMTKPVDPALVRAVLAS